MSDRITTFAKGETIPFTYTGISYAGTTPTSLTGLTFIFTIRKRFGLRTVISRITSDDDITAAVVSGAIVVTFSLDTNTADYVVGEDYEFDFWVVDATTGKHRLHTGVLALDDPETEVFA